MVYGGVHGIRARMTRQSGIPKRRAARFLPRDPVILEAGAHVGIDTRELARRWRAAVHAFEPLSELFARLERNTADLPNVRRYPWALGDRNGTAEMWVSSGSDGSSSLLASKTHLEMPPLVSFERKVTVPVTTIDAWASRAGVEHIDFMWLDMQGYELAALREAEEILTTVRAIVLEMFLTEQYEGAPLWPDVREWLGSRGFEVVEENVLGPDGGDALVARQPSRATKEVSSR